MSPVLPKPFQAPDANKAMFYWLMTVAVFVVLMILVGGATRLTDSGLSITEWKPVTGAIPPLTQQGWELEFEKYRQIPEYKEQNLGMSMAEFQFIYWWEWGHRQLGRVLGLVYALPFALFIFTGMIPKHLRLRLWGLFALGGLQGAIGWWMVSSGLVDRLDVSQYRLATHLTMAFIILGISLWTALDLRYGRSSGEQRSSHFIRLKFFWMFVLIQIALGAFVAGLDAGRIYTSWPGFNGQLFPDDYLSGLPFWAAIFESRVAVQFQHRWFAYILAVFGAWTVYKLVSDLSDPIWRHVGFILSGFLAAQIILGILTLVHAAPLVLSLAHQAGAIILFCGAGWASWVSTRRI